MSATKDAYPRLLATLDDVRRQWRLHKLLEGLLLTAAGLLAVLVLLVAADNVFQPDRIFRALFAAVLWGGLIVAVLSLVVKRFMEDRRDDYFAALVERKHPGLRNALINALQLGRDNTPGVSKALVEQIIHDADRKLGDAEVTDAVDRRPTRRAGIAALIALLIIATYGGVAWARFSNGFSRVLAPWAEIEPYTQTRILAEDVTPGSTRVPEGKAIDFAVTTRGVLPERARLHRKLANGSWQVNEMAPDTSKAGAFRFVVPQAGSSFEYFVTAGDARSPRFLVEVVKPPQVAKLSVEYTYPKYTGLPSKRLDSFDGEVIGVTGTAVKLELTATKPLKEARLVTRADDRTRRPSEEIALEKEGDHYVARFVIWSKDAKVLPEFAGQRLLTAPTSYQLLMEDTDGYANVDPLWRPIVARIDRAPEVVLRAPDDRLTLKAETVLPVGVDTRDDYGLGRVRILCRVNNEDTVREVVAFEHEQGEPKLQTSDRYQWRLGSSGLKVGDRVEYWAEALDRNDVTGPGKSESRRFRLEVVNPLDVLAKLDVHVRDYTRELREIIKLQRQNRAETDGGVEFGPLTTREIEIRKRTGTLARAIEGDGVPAATIVEALDKLVAGDMAKVLKLFEAGATTQKESLAAEFRKQSLPLQDRIIKELEDILTRLLRNEEARKALKKLEKEDPKAHKAAIALLTETIKGLDKLLKDQTETAGKFERLPKKDDDKFKEDMLKALNDLEDMKKRSEKWAKGTVQELTKMPKGFTDDFDLRKDVNKVYEEIEKATTKSKAEKLEVSLEDLGAGLATKMKEDLEMWMPDAADSVKWVLEEPLNKKPMKIPEMPLPKDLQDLVGDLLQRADEFDEDADDVTSAWGDNLDQAGWGVSDGPISTFSAKGKTGNDQPNNMEVSGRSGDGRRGKSSGQMVGDTAKALPGRKTPARVGSEKYEPGQLKAEGQEDPNGATGGGKKTGSGRRGLQGGSPPDPVKDVGRLSAKQAGMREKMEQVARKLEGKGVSTTRLKEGIKLLEEADKDLTDRKYNDAAKKRRDSMQKLREAFGQLDDSTRTQIKNARDLPQDVRKDLLQSSDSAYPAGYEELLKSYYKALSAGEK